MCVLLYRRKLSKSPQLRLGLQRQRSRRPLLPVQGDASDICAAPWEVELEPSTSSWLWSWLPRVVRRVLTVGDPWLVSEDRVLLWIDRAPGISLRLCLPNRIAHDCKGCAGERLGVLVTTAVIFGVQRGRTDGYIGGP